MYIKNNAAYVILLSVLCFCALHSVSDAARILAWDNGVAYQGGLASISGLSSALYSMELSSPYEWVVQGQPTVLFRSSYPAPLRNLAAARTKEQSNTTGSVTDYFDIWFTSLNGGFYHRRWRADTGSLSTSQSATAPTQIIAPSSATASFDSFVIHEATKKVIFLDLTTLTLRAYSLEDGTFHGIVLDIKYQWPSASIGGVAYLSSKLGSYLADSEMLPAETSLYISLFSTGELLRCELSQTSAGALVCAELSRVDLDFDHGGAAFEDSSTTKALANRKFQGFCFQKLSDSDPQLMQVRTLYADVSGESNAVVRTYITNNGGSSWHFVLQTDAPSPLSHPSRIHCHTYDPSVFYLTVPSCQSIYSCNTSEDTTTWDALTDGYIDPYSITDAPWDVAGRTLLVADHQLLAVNPKVGTPYQVLGKGKALGCSISKDSFIHSMPIDATHSHSTVGTVFFFCENTIYQLWKNPSDSSNTSTTTQNLLLAIPTFTVPTLEFISAAIVGPSLPNDTPNHKLFISGRRGTMCGAALGNYAIYSTPFMNSQTRSSWEPVVASLESSEARLFLLYENSGSDAVQRPVSLLRHHPSEAVLCFVLSKDSAPSVRCINSTTGILLSSYNVSSHLTKTESMAFNFGGSKLVLSSKDDNKVLILWWDSASNSLQLFREVTIQAPAYISPTSRRGTDEVIILTSPTGPSALFSYLLRRMSLQVPFTQSLISSGTSSYFDTVMYMDEAGFETVPDKLYPEPHAETIPLSWIRTGSEPPATPTSISTPPDSTTPEPTSEITTEPPVDTLTDTQLPVLTTTAPPETTATATASTEPTEQYTTAPIDTYPNTTAPVLNATYTVNPGNSTVTPPRQRTLIFGMTWMTLILGFCAVILPMIIACFVIMAVFHCRRRKDNMDSGSSSEIGEDIFENGNGSNNPSPWFSPRKIGRWFKSSKNKRGPGYDYHNMPDNTFTTEQRDYINSVSNGDSRFSIGEESEVPPEQDLQHCHVQELDTLTQSMHTRAGLTTKTSSVGSGEGSVSDNRNGNSGLGATNDNIGLNESNLRMQDIPITPRNENSSKKSS